jgi:hypothetical protein
MWGQFVVIKVPLLSVGYLPVGRKLVEASIPSQAPQRQPKDSGNLPDARTSRRAEKSKEEADGEISWSTSPCSQLPIW